MEAARKKLKFDLEKVAVSPTDLVILRSSEEIGQDQAYVYVTLLGDILRDAGLENPLLFMNPNWSIETVPFEIIEKIYLERKADEQIS